MYFRRFDLIRRWLLYTNIAEIYKCKPVQHIDIDTFSTTNARILRSLAVCLYLLLDFSSLPLLNHVYLWDTHKHIHTHTDTHKHAVNEPG